ncbi:laminin subunit alpha-5-like [Ailuropoda melanoleuca]|uniref:laminin subunit alpha-5-like n=1 Tax=Ailuropoda melanoleuca TaxID=9646 RepID=UPI001494CF92|nr:laminin subunit alpha-5-like [Ailuropoda melanoleuca]
MPDFSPQRLSPGRRGRSAAKSVAGGDPNQTIQGQYCDICTAANSNRAHPVSNAIDGTERWWQSPPLSRGLEYNEVNVTLDLGQVFHVAYVLIKFANSPRPDLWVLERSTDFGQTYQPWHFFASSKRDCLERFGPQTLERITRDDQVVCSTEYSRIVPLENGEVGPGVAPWASKRDCLERFGPQTLERITRDDQVVCSTEYSRIVPLENGERKRLLAPRPRGGALDAWGRLAELMLLSETRALELAQGGCGLGRGRWD